MHTLAVIVYIEVSLQIPHAQSLKDKRQCIKGVKERLHSGFNASVAEIAAQDSWQRAVFGVVMIASDKSYLQSQVSQVENYLSTLADLVLLDTQIQWL